MDGVIVGSYSQLNNEIKQTLRRSASDVVLLGYLLRRMMEEKIWEVGYACFDEYLKEELHIDYTMANRFMGIHRKYSAGGSREIDGRWEGYSQAVLIEMLNMPPELEATITPDMTVRQVREIKRQANREKSKKEVTESSAKETENQAKETVTEVRPQQSYEALPEVLEESSLDEMQDTKSGIIPLQEEIPDVQFQEVIVQEEVATSQSEKSAYGLKKTVYPEGSLLTSEGCGGKYYCFSCAQDCGIRQKYLYCRYAPLGSPFGCATMEKLREIKAKHGDRCQFVNNALAFHTAGSHEADPCCMECNEICEYRCEKSIREGDSGLQDSEKDNIFEELPGECITDEFAEMKHILNEEQKKLDKFLKVGGLPEKRVFKQKTIVAAIAAMVCELENMNSEVNQEEKKEQPSIPILKNAEQRKEWLRAYKDWGLWYQDDHIGVEYYKFDFENGARLIAEVYQVEATQYCDAYESCHLHLVGGPKPSMDQHGICKWTRHEHYNRYPNSETELVEFLKELQKKRDE